MKNDKKESKKLILDIGNNMDKLTVEQRETVLGVFEVELKTDKGNFEFVSIIDVPTVDKIAAYLFTAQTVTLKGEAHAAFYLCKYISGKTGSVNQVLTAGINYNRPDVFPIVFMEKSEGTIISIVRVIRGDPVRGPVKFMGNPATD